MKDYLYLLICYSPIVNRWPVC